MSPPSLHKSLDEYASPSKPAEPYPMPDYYAHEPLKAVTPVKSPGRWEAETGVLKARPDGPLEGAPLNGTVECSHLDVTDMPDLRNEWEKFGGSPEHCLRMAAARGEMGLLRRAMRVADLDDGDEHRRAALHCACESGHLEIVRALKVAGADIEIEDDLGRTPIMSAAWCGHLQVVRYLARTALADIDAQSMNGMTATHFAAKYGHEAVVIALLQEFKAIPDVVDKMGATARAYAVEMNHKSVAGLLP